MTKEDKDLLVRDLSARLPYDTIISVDDGNRNRKDVKLHPHYIFDWDAERWDAKPYLRPMSSMTEKDHKEWRALDKVLKMALEISRLRKDGEEIDEAKASSMVLQAEVERDQMQIDWLNSHHFDYRGLIEKGLALEAPKDMYDLNNESM